MDPKYVAHWEEAEREWISGWAARFMDEVENEDLDFCPYFVPCAFVSIP